MSRLGEGGVWEGGANGIFGQPISDAGAGRLPPGRDEMGAVGGVLLGNTSNLPAMHGQWQKKFHFRGSGNAK